MRNVRVLMTAVMCVAVLMLWGCPAQQADETAEVEPPPDEAMPAADEMGQHMAEDHQPGEHMGEEHEMGEHVSEEHEEEGAETHYNPSELELSGELQDGTRVVQVEARRYEFAPTPIVVKAGEPVRLEVTATDVTHGFGLEAMDVDRELPPGETQTIEFTPQEPGQHHIHCTYYCGPGHDEMEGALVVKE